MHPMEVSIQERLDLGLQRLAAVLPRAGSDHALLAGLLHEVEGALERLEAGTFGACEVCHGTVEIDRLVADPLLRVCLGCLSPAELRALEHDLETAAAVQAAMLPPADLAAAGWEVHFALRPAGPVSGDFCDLLEPERDGGPLHLVFGDASGKGVSGSLLTSQLHAVFRSLLAVERPLPAILEDANRMFSRHIPASRFATVVAGRLAADGGVEIANAGHPPPLLLRRRANGSPRRVERLTRPGLPLGLFPRASYAAARERLRPGDTLVLFTDGLSEAAAGDGEEYGAARLERVLGTLDGASAREVASACLDDLVRFRAGGAAHDDLALLVVRRIE